MTIFMFSSNVPRAKETAKIISKQIGNVRYIIRDIFSYNKHPKKFKETRQIKQQTEETEDDIVKAFLEGKREGITTAILAKPFIKQLKTVFDRTIRKNIQISVIAFRHGDKDSNGNLSESGKDQAKLLGNQLKNEINNNGDTILICTHNVINESVIRCLIDNNNLPKEREEPLKFAETVKYTFHPKGKDNQPLLEIKRRDTTRNITYEEFKDLTKNLIT